MFLQRYSRAAGHGRHPLTVLLMAALLVAGCASTPSSNGGNREKSAAAQSKALEDVPTAALALYEQALTAMASGDVMEAQLRFEEFVLQFPDYPGAHVNLAIIHARNGNDQAAENSITDALMLNPQHAAALNQLGMLLRRQGKFPEAKAAYLKAVTAEPEYALAHYNLGVLSELYMQDLDTALQHYERYQALDGDDEQIGKWIADIKRRIDTAQRTANVTE